MPGKTTITSERARELGRRGAAAVERDPITKRFKKREVIADPPVTEPPEPPPAPPVPDPPDAEVGAPSFKMARSIFRRKGRRA